ncbi:MAG: AraC family transcriptional regulator [Oscillospiraceae bacterium]|nr:AraC family transcriptional regulator [Oscillospiraceae bacterium]
MPQFDRHRSVEVPIEYENRETLKLLPVSNRLTIILITDGKTNIVLNNKAMLVYAPCVICLSDKDTLDVIDNGRLYAQSFSFSPAYLLRNRKTFKQIKNEDYDVLTLFYHRDDSYFGVINLLPQVYIRIFEWLCIIGTEINAQSDSRWTCRIRAYFLQILNLLDDIYANRKNIENADSIYAKDSPVDRVMEYIHMHYMDNITLGRMCELVHINRTSLGRLYKERTGQTVIEYLLNYRLRVATELLAHTGLTVDEIARQSGFGYDTYLIRQFTAKKGETPTEYRQAARVTHSIVIEKG